MTWNKSTRLSDPPVITSRDYGAAEEGDRYRKVAEALRDKTALLLGFSLSDPNLARIIRAQAKDCRALVVASPMGFSPAQQSLRLSLLRRYWQGLNIAVTAIEAHEELPAFLLELRRQVGRQLGSPAARTGAEALRAAARIDWTRWFGAREWRDALSDAVTAAKRVSRSVAGDRTLRAGFYAIEEDGYLAHIVGSESTEISFTTWPPRRLLADDPLPWGAAGYSFAAGVPIASSAVGAAFDRNVPTDTLIEWQSERAAQRRLPASSVVCVPLWVRYRGRIEAIGVLYYSTRRGAAFEDRAETDALQSLLEYTGRTMIKVENQL
jgi:hypothetical protein